MRHLTRLWALSARPACRPVAAADHRAPWSSLCPVEQQNATAEGGGEGHTASTSGRGMASWGHTAAHGPCMQRSPLSACHGASPEGGSALWPHSHGIMHISVPSASAVTPPLAQGAIQMPTYPHLYGSQRQPQQQLQALRVWESSLHQLPSPGSLPFFRTASASAPATSAPSSARSSAQSTSTSSFSPLLCAHRSPQTGTTPTFPWTWTPAQGTFLPRPQLQCRGAAQLSRRKVPKSAGFNDTLMPNTTTLKFGAYGIRAMTGKRVAANTIEAVRRTLRRRLKKDAKLWIRIEATVPVTRKPEGIRMGKGKGAIAFYATPVRPGQIIFEMDRIPRNIALQAMESIQPKFPCRLGFVEWS